MEPSAVKCLEERILQEVQTILTEGDWAYLQKLSCPVFLDALENELRFLGLYAHSDRETPAVLRHFLEQHVDQWRAALNNLTHHA